MDSKNSYVGVYQKKKENHFKECTALCRHVEHKKIDSPNRK